MTNNNMVELTSGPSSSSFQKLMKVPEVLKKIFSYLDSNSLNVAGQVCQKWSAIVQLIHDDAWRSLTKAVSLMPNKIGPKYEKKGWIEQAHSWNMCNCVDMAREFVIYDDLELLARHLEVVDTNYIKDKAFVKAFGKGTLMVKNLEDAEAVSSLAAARIFTTIHMLFLSGADLASISKKIDFSSVRNIGHLVKIVTNRLQILHGCNKNLPNILDHIQCRSLIIGIHPYVAHVILSAADLKSITEVLDNVVEEIVFTGIGGFGRVFSYFKNYDGRGKCSVIAMREYDFELPCDLPLAKVKLWASSRGWSIEIKALDVRTNVFLRRKCRKCCGCQN